MEKTSNWFRGLCIIESAKGGYVVTFDAPQFERNDEYVAFETLDEAHNAINEFYVEAETRLKVSRVGVRGLYSRMMENVSESTVDGFILEQFKVQQRHDQK